MGTLHSNAIMSRYDINKAYFCINILIGSLATLHDFIKFRNQQCFQDNENGYDAVDPQRNIDIFTQILEGAAYIHEQGVMHRDLKPTNIFLSMPASLNESRRSSQSNRRHGRSRANSLATGPRSHGSISSSSNHGMSSSASSSFAHDHSFSFDSVQTPDGLRQCMWDEPWVPKIGDFGLAAASEEDQDLSSYMEDQHLSSDENSNSKEVSENTTPRRRPSVRRMRTGGVGTRTVSCFLFLPCDNHSNLTFLVCITRTIGSSTQCLW